MSSMDKTVKMTVTVPASLLEATKRRAEIEQRNLSNMVTVLLTEGMKKEKAA